MSFEKHENRWNVRGNVGADPEKQITASGKSVTTVRIATSWSRNTGTQANPVWQEEADWHRLTAYGKDADMIHQNVRKGDLFAAECRVSPRKWTDKENVVHYTTDYVINKITVMPFRQRAQQNQGQGNQGNQQGRQSQGGQDEREIPFGEDDLPPSAFDPNDMPG